LSGSSTTQLLTETDGNGFVGLAPFSLNNALHKKYNFMWYLKSQGYIDEIVFAIFTDLDKSEGSDSKLKSHIKIGGYDKNEETLKDGAELSFMTTKDLESWSISINDVNLVM